MRKVLGIVAVGILAIFILVLAVKGLLLLVYIVFLLGKFILALLFTLGLVYLALKVAQASGLEVNKYLAWFEKTKNFFTSFASR